MQLDIIKLIMEKKNLISLRDDELKNSGALRS
jgi:hypothetical protein